MTAVKIRCKQVLPTLKVKDIRMSLKFYTEKLGFIQAFTWGEPVNFAGLACGDVMIHLSEEANVSLEASSGAASRASSDAYSNASSDASLDSFSEKSEVFFVIDNVDILYKNHLANHVRVVAAIGDREYGLRDYAVADPDGNELGFGQYIYNYANLFISKEQMFR